MKMPDYETEYTTAQDPFYDFCLWEYKPAVSPVNKMRSSNLLFNSFETASLSRRIWEIVRAIREGFGVHYTVWGIKKLEDEIRWEFYFYDYRRRERERSITRLLDLLRPLVRCGIEANEDLHYFMFSIDITQDLVSGELGLEEVHLYIGNPGSTVSSGICYSLTKTGTRLENFYFFFDAKRERAKILNKMICSAHVDFSVIDIQRVLWPEMSTCQVLVVANKQENDAVYFSRINVDQLIFFVRKMKYKRESITFIEENRSRLNHLLFDAGFDYRMEEKDLVILKSGFYGVF